MPKEKSAMDEFLGDITPADKQRADDIFEKPLTDKEGSEEDLTVITPLDNREERRAKKALKAEREANIALNERIKVLSEVKKESQSTNVDEDLIRLYGDNENGRAAAKITQDLLERTKREAQEEMLVRMREQSEAEQQEVANSEQELDSMLEDLEDEFNVDLTSDTPQAKKARQGFFAALEEVSPKKNGVVTDYADPIATWKYYQAQQKPADTRAKDLSARSMTRSGNAGESKLQASATERFLKDNGII